MICSLLFYALYPLSRYLTAGRRAVVHGTAALDGGAVTTRRFTQSQTTLQDQWLCSSSSAKGKAEEGMKEQSPQKESDKEMEQKKEQPVAFSREEPQNEAMTISEEPQNEAMTISEEPQNGAMKMCEEPQNEAMKMCEEPQNEAMKMCEEPQNEAMTISEEPQNEAMTISEEPQNEAMKMCEEPQNEAMTISEEPQNEAMKMCEEPQNGAMKMSEEPQNGAMKMSEEPQNGAMKMCEEPQNGAIKMCEEPQNGAMKMSEEPQNEAMKMSEEPQNEAMKMSEEPQNEAMKMCEEPQNEVTKTREEPQNEVTKKREEPQNEAMKTVEMPQDKMEVFMQQDICEYRRQHTEEATDVPVEDLQLEQALTAQLKCLQTDYSIEEAVCPGLEKIQIYTPILKVEESFITAEERIEETTSLTRHQIQIPSIESETLPVSKISECWDEYYIDYADDEGYDGANSFNLVLDSQLSDSPTHLTFSKQRNTQNSLHFPAGLGLTEEVQCPLWQFPAGSYYPSLVSSESFEVMWRVWQSATTAEPDLVPFPFTKTAMFFTVMSYNILAQDLLEANQDLYMHCPLEVLDWSFRCSLLLEEILKWAPDILCLQEVQENHYYEQLYPALCQMGYTCVYKCRTGPKTDGCATCYRSSCFSEVSVSPLEFFRPDTELLNRHNVGLVLLLRPVITQGSEIKATGPLLCVGNTHLLFNPRRGDVKLTQLAMMLAEIDSIVKSCKANGEHCNIVLCGDFNSVPHMPLYQLVTTGKLHYQGLPAWMISGQDDLSLKTHCHRLSAPLWPSCLGITDNCQYSTFKNKCENKSQKSGKIQYSHDFMRQLRYCPAACIRPLDLMLIHGVTDNMPDPSLENPSYDTCFRHTISHHLDLESVYKHILPGSGAPEVTTVHSEVGATVDYIFYSPKRFSPSDQIACGNSVSEGLKLIGSLSLLSEDVLWSMKGLPNHQFPSDHLSLLAQFQLDLNAAW